jgi:hypothetical protein
MAGAARAKLHLHHRRQPAHRLRAAASLDLIAAGDARRQHLWQLVAQLRAGLADTRWQLLPSPTAIQPVIIGDNHDALRVASALFERPVGTGDPAADGAQGKRASARVADRGPQRSRSGPPGRRPASAGMSVLIGQDPELALVHGWGLGSAVWQPLLEPLSRSCRVHPVDLPGYGQSPASDAPISPKRHGA